MNLRPAALPLTLAVTVAVALTACGPATTPGTTAAAGKIAVVASTDVYGSIVAAVGGDAVTVTSLIDNPAADPHEYESTPKDAAAVNAAKLVVLNGADYDPFAEKLVATATTKPTTIDVADLSGLAASTPQGQDFNEHVWYSLPTAKKLADTIARDLGAADPAAASTFTANAAAFTKRIDGLQSQLAAIKARHSGERVAITEPVPLYLLDAAGLVNATPPEFSEAVEAGTDAPAAVVAQTLAIFTGPGKVRALVANTQTEDAATKQVAQAATAGGVPIVQVTETLPAGTTDYVAWMTQQTGALAAALDQAA